MNAGPASGMNDASPVRNPRKRLNDRFAMK
jgi:hypothetical protein